MLENKTTGLWRRVVSLGLRGACAAGLLLGGGCIVGPRVLPPDEQGVIDRKVTEYPTGFELRPYLYNLNNPTGFCFDDLGNLIVTEGGYDNEDPRIFGIRPNGTRFDIYPIETRIPIIKPGFRVYGPVGGIACYRGRIYVAHRDEHDRGVITSFGYDGSHVTIVADMPTQGDHGMGDIAFSPIHERLYFGIGATTNSGVVGLDNWEAGWVRDHPDASDMPAKSIKLLGYRFDANNPRASVFTSDTTVTVPFEPFGVSDITRIPASAIGKPTGAIYSISPEGGDLRVEAWGVRDPVGMVVNEFGRIYFTDQGMELRGTRPIAHDPDGLFRLVTDAWYGWPDFSRSLHPVGEARYQPPSWMVIPTGYPDVGFVIDHQASGLADPDSRWLAAQFPSQAGASKMDFAPSTGPFREYAGNLVVALWGDRAPFSNWDQPLEGNPAGYKVVRVDPDRREVDDFVFNTAGGPASKLEDKSSYALERPIDVKFGPDGSLYILDFGRIRVVGGKIKVYDGTGKVFRLVPVSQSGTP
jgi:glucose/arabinose dehydrogenase